MGARHKRQEGMPCCGAGFQPVSNPVPAAVRAGCSVFKALIVVSRPLTPCHTTDIRLSLCQVKVLHIPYRRNPNDATKKAVSVLTVYTPRATRATSSL